MKAGRLSNLITIQRRDTPSTKYRSGGEPWTDVVTRRPADISPIMARGGENVLADRLVGSRPAVINVRDEPLLASLTTAWRVVDAETSQIYNIRSFARPSRQPGKLVLTVEAGVTDDGD